MLVGMCGVVQAVAGRKAGQVRGSSGQEGGEDGDNVGGKLHKSIARLQDRLHHVARNVVGSSTPRPRYMSHTPTR